MCELLSAVRDGREEKTHQLLGTEHFYNLPSWNQGQGIVLLREALARGHSDIAKLLLSKGARVNNKFGNPTNDPLHFAVCLPDSLDIVGQLIKEGAKINSANGDGCTPLHLAVFSNNESATKLLLDSQATPDSEDLVRNTPLHVAAERGFPKMAELLLNHGAKPDTPLVNGFTPLHLACLNAMTDTVTVLLNHGADPNACSDHGTALDLVYPNQDHLESLDRRISVIEKLVKAGAKVNSFDQDGRTILHRAVEHNCIGVVAATVKQSNVNALSIDISQKSLLSPIQMAAQSGFNEITELLISHGADINMPCNVSLGGNYTPLHLACSHGHIDVVRTLLEHGADTEVKSLEGRTPLLAAVCHFKGQVETLLLLLQLLVSSGADIGTFDQDSACVLHAAVEQQCLPLTRLVVKLLVESRGLAQYINHPTITGLTPLHMAAANGSIELAEFLLSHGANINMVSKVPTSEGLTALHVASKNAHMDIIKLFIDKGADVNALTSLNQTPAHVILSTRENFSHRNIQNAVAVLAVLLETLGDIDSVDKNGNTILNLGVKLRCLPVVETILRYNPNPKNPINRTALRSAVVSGTKFSDGVFGDFSLKLRNDAIMEVRTIIKTLQDYGLTFNDSDIKDKAVLHHAICKGHSDVVQYLLNHDADFQAQSEFGTPLHSAVRMLHLDIVKVLISMGADVNAKDPAGNNLIFYVNEKIMNSKFKEFSDSQVCLEVAKELLKGGADLTNDSKFLMIAIEKRSEELVRLALGCNADRNAVASNGFTILHTAVRTEDENLVKLVIDQGVDIDARDVISQTPLHLAVSSRKESVTKVLLDRGADVNLEDGRSYTPLHHAACWGNVQVIEMLLERGAETEVCNNKSLTPLLLAAEHGQGKALVALLRGGACARVRRPDSTTTLHLAAERTDAATVETLVYFGADVTARTSSGLTPLGFAVQACKTRIVQTLLNNGGYTRDMCCNIFQATRWFARRKIDGSAALNDVINQHFLAVEALQLWQEEPTCYCRSSFVNAIEEKLGIELSALKSKTLTNKLTYFDIISKPKHQLVSLARNGSIAQSLPLDFTKEFPIMGKLLHGRWTAAVTREKLLTVGTSSFNALVSAAMADLVNSHKTKFPQTLRRYGYGWILRVLKFAEGTAKMSNDDFVRYLEQIQFLIPAAVVEKVLGHLTDTELRDLSLAAPTVTPTSPLDTTAN